MKTKNLTKPIFLILLMLGSVWWSNCSCPDENYCSSAGKTVYGLDTQYYGYVGDFLGTNKYYTYRWVIDDDTSFVIYKIGEFKYHQTVEYSNFANDCKDVINVPCDTQVTSYYESEITDQNGIKRSLFKCGSEGFLFTLSNTSNPSAVPVVIDEGYSFYPSIRYKRDTMFFSPIDSSKIEQKWHLSLKIKNFTFTDVREHIKISYNGDTVRHLIYNKGYSIIKYKIKTNEKNQKIDLVQIQG